MIKRCCDCNEEYPLSRRYFYKKAASADGFTDRCRKCHRLFSQANPDAEITPNTFLQMQGLGFGHWGTPQYKGRVYYPLSIQTKMLHSDPRVQAQYKRQKGRCYYCSDKVGQQYHVDHVVPTSRFGENEAHNIVISCPDCNVAKGNKMPHEWPEGGRLL